MKGDFAQLPYKLIYTFLSNIMARHPKRSAITGRVRRECVRQRTSNARWLHLSTGEASNRQVVQFLWGLTVNAALIFTTYGATTLLLQQVIGDPTLSADLGSLQLHSLVQLRHTPNLQINIFNWTLIFMMSLIMSMHNHKHLNHADTSKLTIYQTWKHIK